MTKASKSKFKICLTDISTKTFLSGPLSVSGDSCRGLCILLKAMQGSLRAQKAPERARAAPAAKTPTAPQVPAVVQVKVSAALLYQIELQLVPASEKEDLMSAVFPDHAVLMAVILA